MTSRDSVRYRGTNIEYEVRRSTGRKKTVQITLTGNGVLVAAPAKLPAKEIREIVRKRARWIVGRLSEAALQATPMRFVSGETLPYLGRDVKMVVESGDVPASTVRFNQWCFQVAVPTGIPETDRADRIRHSIIQWYKDLAADRLQTGVELWRPKLGVGEQPRILVRDQRSRWGSCASDGTLRFNWRVMMLEPALIDYVMVHELAHLTVMNHSNEFWGLVSDVLPDVQNRRKLLREAGRMLPL